MAGKITKDDITRINDAYFKYKTYAAAARETGFSPSTIKKYVISGYNPNMTRTVTSFAPRRSPLYDTQDWTSSLNLSEKEIFDIKELWKELVL